MGVALDTWTQLFTGICQNSDGCAKYAKWDGLGGGKTWERERENGKALPLFWFLKLREIWSSWVPRLCSILSHYDFHFCVCVHILFLCDSCNLVGGAVTSVFKKKKRGENNHHQLFHLIGPCATVMELHFWGALFLLVYSITIISRNCCMC